MAKDKKPHFGIKINAEKVDEGLVDVEFNSDTEKPFECPNWPAGWIGDQNLREVGIINESNQCCNNRGQ